MSGDPERERALAVYQNPPRRKETIGRLKRAMIDAFMAEKVFGATFGHGGNRFEFKKDEYLLRGYVPVGGDDHVARPDEFGSGGGRAWKTMIPGVWDQSYGSGKDLDYTAEFDDIRAWVDDLVDKWVGDLPDLAGIGEGATQFDRICTSLRLDGGTISGHVNQLEQDLSSPNLAGSTIGAFRTKFVTNLRTVLNGHSCIAALLASSMAAQQAAWEEVRAGFVLTVEAYTQVFESLAGLGGSPEAKVQLQVLRYAADAAADGPWALVLNVAADALGLVALPKDAGREDSRSPGSFAEGKTALKAALGALNLDLYETEKKIRDTITSNMDEVASTKRVVDGRQYPDNRKHYDLSLVPVADFTVANPDLIGWDGDVVRSIVNGPMRAIAEELHEQRRVATTWDGYIADRVKRDSGLGLGTYGPAATVHELNEMLCDLLGDLRWEVETGADQLWLAYDANMRHNDQAAADLAAINAQLPQGSGYDPWDYQAPRGPAPTPAARGWLIPIWRMTVSPEEFETKPDRRRRTSGLSVAGAWKMRAPRVVGSCRRRVVLSALVLSVAFVLTTIAACTHQPEDPYYPACPGLTSAPAAAQTADGQAEPYETTTYTFVVVGNARFWDDVSGSDWVQSPEWKATVSVGSWVRGSDRAGLDSAWRAVSKTGAMPLPSGPYGKTWAVAEVGYDISLETRYACLDSQEAAYIFGTVTFEDLTEFPEPPVGYVRPAYPTSYEIQDVALELVPGPGGAEIPEFFGCYEQRCGQSEKGRESEDLLLPLIYRYGEENGESGPGPHPFVIAVPDAFTSLSGADQTLVLDSVLHLVKGTFPIEQDGDQGLGTDIPTRLGW